jgi:three-Cys-motif partner protein
VGPDARVPASAEREIDSGVIRLAQDGLPARVSGRWTQEKLTYVERYAAAFMRAMAPKRRVGRWSELVYVDLLCGPGRGIDRDTGAEFDGSPLRAIRITPGFDRLFFADLRARNVDALRRRIPPEHLARADLRVGDCNTVAEEVVRQLPSRALGLAFIDPQGFEATFRLFQTLATRRLDVLFLFPSGIGIVRNLRRFAKQAHSPMDDLWGGREWRGLPPARLAVGQRLTPEEAAGIDKPWLLGFRTKMNGIGFQYQDEADPCFVNEKSVPMYHLLFFSRDLAGLTIWRGIKRVEPSGQRRLPL